MELPYPYTSACSFMLSDFLFALCTLLTEIPMISAIYAFVLCPNEHDNRQLLPCSSCQHAQTLEFALSTYYQVVSDIFFTSIILLYLLRFSLYVSAVNFIFYIVWKFYL